ncbi:cell wall-binding repeat protein [Streptococcus mitis SK575]|uniref:Cell wall-binding repeat protein n=1 Tax=Streptococcus mitis SK575 TaxID=1095736 RepID=I0SRB7_STRMT|nr:N-acetylmuramoyl-L-alanine amidase family protein [Streptococcus mitis]EID25920.1 cell wall-binding repeat protein [Streptococcus mitis SK575]
MKKEMKHALVALGLSTLLVPSFTSQVVFAQEESHETTTSTTREEVKKEIDNIRKSYIELQEKDRQDILKQIDEANWSSISFSQNDVEQIKKKVSENFTDNRQRFLSNLDNIEKELLSAPLWYSKERLATLDSHKNYNDYLHNLNFQIFDMAIQKKKELVITQIRENPYYTSLEREITIKIVSEKYDYRGPNSYKGLEKYSPSYDIPERLSEYLRKLVSFYSNDFRPYTIPPTEKNIREINAVAFMEKTAISNDDALSKADKVSMFSKIDDIVEEAVRKIKTEADIREDANYKNSRMLSAEELSVFTKRIEDVYQGKAKPKVTKEEAIQAVSTGTSYSVSTSSQATVTSNGETKKNHQASKWFKESGKWYYNDLSGNLVRNRWVGRYYLKADASMAASEWIYDEDYKSWFYVDSTGSYVEKAWQGEYYLKRGGYMAKSEWVFDSQYDSWYYLNQDGKYARNQWIKDGDKWYYLLADGKLAKNMTINGYKVNEKGEWV